MRVLSVISLVLLACAGCKKDPPPKAAAPDPTLQRKRVYRLEIESAKASKVIGGSEKDNPLENLLAEHGLYFYLPEKEAQTCWVGFTGAPGSFSTSSYTRAKFKIDPTSVRLEPFQVGVQLRDGRRLDLDLAGARITPVGAMPDDGVLEKDLQLEAKGGFAITTGETRLSGTLEGIWRGSRDDSPPDVQIAVPPEGLVTGIVRVLFDEPVTMQDLPQRYFLRDAQRNPLDVDVVATKTDIPDATTEVLIKPRALLPFDARLSVAVSSEVADLLGRRLEKPMLATFDTGSAPPYLVSTVHDFAEARGEAEFTKIGAVDFLPGFGQEKPTTGRLLRLVPPSPLATTASAIMTRLVVPANAQRLAVRVRKVARTREQETPCLSVSLARPSGVLWTVECGATEVPRTPFAGPDGEWLGTIWTDVTVPLLGQRGTEVIVIVEAKPRTATMSPLMDTQFLIDRLSVELGL